MFPRGFSVSFLPLLVVQEPGFYYGMLVLPGLCIVCYLFACQTIEGHCLICGKNLG